MIWIDASPVVARMENTQAIRYLTAEEFPGYPMPEFLLPWAIGYTADLENAVPSPVVCSKPKPAPIVRVGHLSK